MSQPMTGVCSVCKEEHEVYVSPGGKYLMEIHLTTKEGLWCDGVDTVPEQTKYENINDI